MANFDTVGASMRLVIGHQLRAIVAENAVSMGRQPLISAFMASGQIAKLIASPPLLESHEESSQVGSCKSVPRDSSLTSLNDLICLGKLFWWESHV